MPNSSSISPIIGGEAPTATHRVRFQNFYLKQNKNVHVINWLRSHLVNWFCKVCSTQISPGGCYGWGKEVFLQLVECPSPVGNAVLGVGVHLCVGEAEPVRLEHRVPAEVPLPPWGRHNGALCTALEYFNFLTLALKKTRFYYKGCGPGSAWIRFHFHSWIREGKIER